MQGTIVLAALTLVSLDTAYAQPTAPISAPADQTLLTVSATGTQVYECRPGGAGALAWTFKEPRADLFEGGKQIGRHYVGPTWAHQDGSKVEGKVVATQAAPANGDIPWLRLAVVARSGEGAFSAATFVQRVHTHGGVLTGACPQAGAVSEVPYSAEYVFGRDTP